MRKTLPCHGVLMLAPNHLFPVVGFILLRVADYVARHTLLTFATLIAHFKVITDGLRHLSDLRMLSSSKGRYRWYWETKLSINYEMTLVNRSRYSGCFLAEDTLRQKGWLLWSSLGTIKPASSVSNDDKAVIPTTFQLQWFWLLTQAYMNIKMLSDLYSKSFCVSKKIARRTYIHNDIFFKQIRLHLYLIQPTCPFY